MVYIYILYIIIYVYIYIPLRSIMLNLFTIIITYYICCSLRLTMSIIIYWWSFCSHSSYRRSFTSGCRWGAAGGMLIGAERCGWVNHGLIDDARCSTDFRPCAFLRHGLRVGTVMSLEFLQEAKMSPVPCASVDSHGEHLIMQGVMVVNCEKAASKQVATQASCVRWSFLRWQEAFDRSSCNVTVSYGKWPSWPSYTVCTYI